METPVRNFVRIAGEIQRQLQILDSHRTEEVRLTIPELLVFMERIEAARRKLTVCAFHGWKAAEAKVMGDLEGTLYDSKIHSYEFITYYVIHRIYCIIQ